MADARDRLPDQEPDREPNGKMGFLEHLDELRSRLIRCCIAVAVGMLIALAFIGPLADFVLAPTLGTLPPRTNLIIARPGEGLAFYLDLALVGGLALAAPYVTYQVWRFIAPGLYLRERRLVIPFIALATIGTLAGAAFSHYVLFPSMMAFFATFDSDRMRFMPRVEDTFELYKNMMIAMVGVFQIPALVFFLARMRLVTAQLLLRQIKYAILASFIVAAVLTPSPDPWNQAAFAAPMIALYLVSVAIAWVVAPPRRTTSRSANTKGNLKLVFAATVIEQVARRHVGRRAPSLRMVGSHRIEL